MNTRALAIATAAVLLAGCSLTPSSRMIDSGYWCQNKRDTTVFFFEGANITDMRWRGILKGVCVTAYDDKNVERTVCEGDSWLMQCGLSR